MKPRRAIFALAWALLVGALCWPGCDYPSVTFEPPVPVPVVSCNDSLSCEGGELCCLHTVMGVCDKCLSLEKCRATTTCGGELAEFVPIGCDSADDCASDWVCCLVVDGAAVEGVACVEASQCGRPLCAAPADCAVGTSCVELVPGEPAYVALTFCL